MSDGGQQAGLEGLPPEMRAKLEEDMKRMHESHARQLRELEQRFKRFKESQALQGIHTGVQLSFIFAEIARTFAAVEMMTFAVEDAVRDITQASGELRKRLVEVEAKHGPSRS